MTTTKSKRNAICKQCPNVSINVVVSLPKVANHKNLTATQNFQSYLLISFVTAGFSTIGERLYVVVGCQ